MGKYDFIKTLNQITICQGSDYSDTITCNQSGGITPVDLTGYTVSSLLKTVDDVLVATFVCTIPDPALGVIHRSLTDSVTLLLNAYPTVEHVYGVQLIAPSGDKLPEIQGGALIIPEIV